MESRLRLNSRTLTAFESAEQIQQRALLQTIELSNANGQLSYKVKNDLCFWLLLILGALPVQSPKPVCSRRKSPRHQYMTAISKPIGLTTNRVSKVVSLAAQPHASIFTKVGKVIFGVILTVSAPSVNATAQSVLRIGWCSISTSSILDSRRLKWEELS